MAQIISAADVEDLLAAPGVIVSREAIRLWVNRFGRHFAVFFAGIVRDRKISSIWTKS